MGEYDRLRGLVAQNMGGPKFPTGGACSFVTTRAGAFSWTVPRAGFYRAHVWGAGGGGTDPGGGSATGGGGGGYADRVVFLRKNDVVTGVVGQCSNGNTGVTGGTSVINLPGGAQLGATGGGGGNSTTNVGGAGGAGFGGDQNLTGGAGGAAGVSGAAGGGSDGGAGGIQGGGTLGGGGGAPGAYGLNGGAGCPGSGGGGVSSTAIFYNCNPGGGGGGVSSGALNLPGQGMVLINFVGQGATV